MKKIPDEFATGWATDGTTSQIACRVQPPIIYQYEIPSSSCHGKIVLTNSGTRQEPRWKAERTTDGPPIMSEQTFVTAEDALQFAETNFY